MRLELIVPTRPVVAGESVPLELRLHTESSIVELPYDYENRDTVTVALLDTDGHRVAEADGFDRLARTLELGTRFPRAVPGTTSIPEGETIVWEADLLAYLDPPGPGHYLLSVTFRVGTSTVSCPPQPVEIRENRASWMDVLSDRTPIPMVYGVQQLPLDDGPRAIFQVGIAARPECTWSGGELQTPPDAQPRVAEVGSTTADVGQAFGRYVAWQEADRLAVVRFDDDHQTADILRADLSPPGLVLLGRPAQHDDGLSILGVVSHPDRCEVHRLDYDLGLVPRGTERVCVLPRDAGPISASRDREGGLCIVAGSAGTAPVWIHQQGPDGAPQARELLSAETLQGPHPGKRRVMLVGLRADLRAEKIVVGDSLVPSLRTSPTVFIVAAVRDDSLRWLSLLALPAASAEGDGLAWRIDVDSGWLPDDEEVTWGDMVLDHLSRPVVVLATSRRRMILLSTDHDPRAMTDVDQARIEQTRLLMIGGSVFLFFPSTTRGTVCERLSTLPSLM